MEQVYKYCPGRRKWRTAARPRTAVYFIPEADLQALIEGSAASQKNEIAKWLQGGDQIECKDGVGLSAAQRGTGSGPIDSEQKPS